MAESETPWSYDVEDNVIVWDIRDWYDPTEEELQQVTAELQSVAGREDITSSVTQLADDAHLDAETLEYIEQNNQMYADLGVTNVGWVSGGIQSLALRSKVSDVDGVDVEAFDELENAVAWAKD